MADASEVREPRAPETERVEVPGNAIVLCLIAGFLPGLLAGTLLAGLLFFLNVQLPFEFGPVVRGVFLYGSFLGCCTALATYLLVPREPRLAWRSLPWTVCAVLAVAAVASGYHAAHYALYLPPGINVRLIKAAVWLSLGALIYFYTALLHSLHARRYGVRSRIGLVLVALASVYVMGERREAFEPRIPPTPLPATIAVGPRPELWVIGIEGASLDAILPLVEQGQLPTFARLLEGGAHARLGSFKPVEPVAHWTTLATGKLPHQHGALARQAYAADFLLAGATLELTPVGDWLSWRAIGPRVPLSASQRESPALWEILDRLGLVTGLSGWPISHPAPPSAAFGFSENYFAGVAQAALPDELAERGLLFRPTEVELDTLVDERFTGHDSTALRRSLGADQWRLKLTAFLNDQKPKVDARFLLLPGLSEISAANYGGFDAVQFDGARRERYRRAYDLVVSYYQYLDRELGELLARAEPARLVAIVSPFGYSAPDDWRRVWRELAGRQLRGAFDSTPDGFLLLSGDGVREGFLESTSLVDIVPTLLYGLGLPVARDLEGRVLTEAFEPGFLARTPLTFVPSYETVAREADLQTLLESGLTGP